MQPTAVMTNQYAVKSPGAWLVWIEHLFMLTSSNMAVAQWVNGRKMAVKQISVSLIFLFIWIKNTKSQLTEYCAGEVFEAECSPGEVIVMRNASYGRVHIGRCIDKHVDMAGYLGCYVNALQYFDNLCSNKQNCRVEISDAQIPLATNCWDELKNNLEVDYTCEKVKQFSCGTSEVPVTETAMISSQSLSRCSTSGTIISAQPGQQLNVSLIDFSRDESMSYSCRQKYGTLRDVLTSNLRDICSTNRRQDTLMLSDGHRVEVKPHSIVGKQFLLKIEVLGCGDVTAQAGAWVRRQGAELVMGCLEGKHTWTLRCQGNHWDGVTGHCGSSVAHSSSVSRGETERTMLGISPAILAFAASSCLLFLSSLVFLVVVCVRTSRNSAGSGFHAVPHEVGYCQTGAPCGTVNKHGGTLPLRS